MNDLPSKRGTLTLIQLRNENVLLDSELAFYLDVETRTLNQAVKRNLEKFPEKWVFQLSTEEFRDLKSQNVISSDKWGGRRSPPWAFTEHGVVLAATLLKSETAIHLTQGIVEFFVQARKGALKNDAQPSPAILPAPQGKLHNGISRKWEKLLEAEINPVDGTTTREEAEQIIAAGLNAVRSILSRQGLENNEIEARIIRQFADTEETRARASTQKEIGEKERLKNKARQMWLQAMTAKFSEDGDLDSIMNVLDKFLDKE